MGFAGQRTQSLGASLFQPVHSIGIEYSGSSFVIPSVDLRDSGSFVDHLLFFDQKTPTRVLTFVLEAWLSGSGRISRNGLFRDV